MISPDGDLVPALTESIAIVRERDRLRRTLDALAPVLDEIEEYLEDREDVVDGSYGEPAPNKEMQLLRELRAARGRQP